MKILIISDIHGNWPALRIVLATESDSERILCLGDLVNYGPQPRECVAWAKTCSPADLVLQGNHDFALGFDQDPRCSPAYAVMASAMQKITNTLLDSESKEFLRGLKPLHSFNLADQSCVACHASPRDPLFEYLPESSPSSLWESELTLVNEPDFLFLGHTHVQMKTRFGRTLVINPGSVGQPKENDPRAAYAVWENGEIRLCRITYDVEETIRAYQGLPLEPHILKRLTNILLSGGEPKPESSRSLNQ